MQSAPLPASQPDLAEIQAIYAHHVLHGTGTFEEVPPSLEEIQARWQAGLAAGYDWLVLKDETGLLGYAYTGPFRQRSAYKWTVEDSVYVRDDVRGQGVGRTLVTALVARAEAAGFRQMLALIGDSENTGSIGVHASLGFTRAGVMRACGVKFGRWLDVVIMQRPLGAGTGMCRGDNFLFTLAKTAAIRSANWGTPNLAERVRRYNKFQTKAAQDQRRAKRFVSYLSATGIIIEAKRLGDASDVMVALKRGEEDFWL